MPPAACYDSDLRAAPLRDADLQAVPESTAVVVYDGKVDLLPFSPSAP